jgi:hypothetical protein
MAKQQNMDVVALKQTRLLDDDTISELRQGAKPDYMPDINLFAVMFEDGPAWVEARAARLFAQGSYSTEERDKFGRDFAKDMTKDIQREYDTCLPDNRLSQMYGMSHDLARLALGMKIPTPHSHKTRVPKANVMHGKRIREYAKGQR